MKRVYYFFVKSGQFIFISLILLTVSISLLAWKSKGIVNYGNRCYQSIDYEVIERFQYKDTSLNNIFLECNTLYLEYTNDLDEKENKLFLAALTKYEKDNNIQCQLQVTIKCKDYQILSSIVNYQISYVKSYL